MKNRFQERIIGLLGLVIGFGDSDHERIFQIDFEAVGDILEFELEGHVR